MLSSPIFLLARTTGAQRHVAVRAGAAAARSLAARAVVRSMTTVRVGASAPVQPCRHPLLATVASRMRVERSMRPYSAKTYPNHIVINMPALSPTMTHGNIGTWRKQPGDEIVPGDVLVEIETDKAQMDFECQEEGFLAKILVESGSKDVDIRTPIAVLVENKDDIAQFADFTVEAAPSAIETKPESSAASEPESKTPEAPTKSESKSSSAASSAAQTSPAGRIKASPLAKTLAVEHGLSLKDVHGSGPNGRITKADVEKLIASGAGAASAAAPAATGPAAAAYTDIPLTNMRKTIAKRLTEAKQQLPHYYLTIEVQMDKINQLRQAFNQTSEGKYRLSVNDFVIKASAQALKDVPEVNSAWHGEQIRQYHSADICVATATPTGLITPIVANAGAKGLAEISNTVKELAGRARKNELKPHEYQGGTFTISNLGMFGIQSFTAIINPPQSCILAVGSSEKKVVPAPNGDGYATINVMKVTLSCDHRVVDGAVGAQWLQAWKRYMENPLSMML